MLTVPRLLLWCGVVRSLALSQMDGGLAPPQDPSPCTLVWPKFGGVYPINDMVYFLFFCKLSEHHSLRLKEEKGKVSIEWNVFLYNVDNGDYDFLKKGREDIHVNSGGRTISQDFKFRLFQKAQTTSISSMKFAMRIFVGGEFVDSLNTVVVPGEDSFLSRMIGESVPCSPGDVCSIPSIAPRHYDFIEIGTSGFDTLIEAAPDNLWGLSVEPLKHLQDTLPNRDNVVKVSCAIGDEPGWKDIYFLPSAFMEYNDVALKDFSEAQFLYGLGRVGEVSQDVVRRLSNSGLMPPYLLYVERSLVHMKTVAQLYSENAILGVSFLKLDCEGFDYRIMQSAFNYFESSKATFPIFIEFENNSDHASADAVVNRLLALGYHVYSFFYEVIRLAHDSSIAAPHGVVYAELPIEVLSDLDKERSDAVLGILPSDLLWGRELCGKYHSTVSEQPTRGGHGLFCSILLSPEKRKVLSISHTFTVL